MLFLGRVFIGRIPVNQKNAHINEGLKPHCCADAPPAGRVLKGVSLAACALVGLSACATVSTPDCPGEQDNPAPMALCVPLSNSNDLTASIPLATLSKPEGENNSAAPARPVKPLKGGKLLLKDAVAKVIEDNPDLGMSAAKEREQFAAIRGAKASSMPTIELTSSAGPQRDWTLDDTHMGRRREIGLSARQTLYDFGASSNNQDRATLSYDSARSARIAKTEQIAFDMLETLMKVQQIDETLALTKRSIAAHSNILSIVKMNESDGNSSVADIKRITTRLENAKGNLIDLTTDRASAADAFRRLTGLDVDTIVDNLTPRLKGNATDIQSAEIARNPEIVSIEKEIASLQKQYSAASSGALPTLGLEGNYKLGRQISEPQESDRRHMGNVLLSFRMPLMDGGANLSQREQILARIQGAQFRLEKRKRELQEDGRGAARIVSSNQSKLTSLDSRVQSARNVVDLYMLQFKEGGRTVFDLLDSQVDLVKAETDLITQKYTRRRAVMKSLLIKGTLVSTIFSTSKS
jgi:outer membrane protein, adhesin transport system